MSVSQDTSLVLVDTRNNPGTITLPAASQILGRLITFKDQSGTFATNHFILSTRGDDTFDDGTTTKIFTESYGSIQVVASVSKWFLVTGTQVNTFTASTIYGSTVSVSGSGYFQTLTTYDIEVSSINGLPVGIPEYALQSTIDGLSMVGYISTSQLASTIDGLANAGYVSSTQLASTMDGLATAGYISSTLLASTVDGLADVGYISSTQLASTMDGLATAGYISSTLLASTVDGLADVGYISSTQLASTMDGLATAGYISSSLLASTVDGLATSGYISTSQLTSTVDGLATAGNASDFTSTVDGLATGGYISTSQLTSTVEGIGSVGNSSDFTSTVDGLANAGYISSTQLASTIDGLGTATYISSTQLASTIDGLGTATYISTLNILSTVDGLGNSGYISSTQLASTVDGLGTATYISSPQLTSTTTGLEIYISTVATTPINNTTGTVLYLNYSISTFSTYKQLGLVETGLRSTFDNSLTIPKQTSNFLFDTFLTDWNLPPFIPAGIWDLNLFANSTKGLTTAYFSIFLYSSTTETLIASTSNYPIPISITTGIFQYDISIPVPYTPLDSGDALLIKIYGNNPDNAKSDTLNFYYEGIDYSHIHTTFGTIIPSQQLTSTVDGLGTAGYVSSQQFYSTITNLGYLGYVSSTQLQSTSIGLGTLGYISSQSLQSTVRSLGTGGYVSSLSLQSTVRSLGTGGYVSSLSLQSTVRGFGTAGYISTAQLQSSITSTLIGLGNIGYISTSQLTSTVQSLQQSAVGVTATLLYSTVDGLGTAGYISSQQLQAAFISTTAGIQNSVSSTASTTYISSLVVSSISFYRGDGYITFQDIQASNVSTIGLWASSLTTPSLIGLSNIRLGANFFQTPIQFYGLNGGFNNTVMAEISTGTTSQEFLIFKGSSSLDQVRIQTTGSFRIETGVSARLFPNVGQDPNVAFFIDNNKNITMDNGSIYINALSNFVGINTLVPSATLDVNGNFRAPAASNSSITVSTFSGFIGYFSSLTVSSINQINGATLNTGAIQSSYMTVSTITGTSSIFSTMVVSSILTVSSLSNTQAFILFATISTLSVSSINQLNGNTLNATSIQSSNITVSSLTTQTLTTSSITFFQGNGYLTFQDLQASNVSTIGLWASSLTTNNIVGLSNFRVGTASNLFTFDVNGTARMSTLFMGGAAATSTNTIFPLAIFNANAPGRVGGTTFTQISDERIKENIVTADYNRCYSDIKSLQLRRFTYVSTVFDELPMKDRNVLGFIAQEVSTIQPKSVVVQEAFGIQDLNWLNIDQMNMALYGAVKQLITNTENLQSTVLGMNYTISTLTGGNV
jgi:hypothetical protein